MRRVSVTGAYVRGGGLCVKGSYVTSTVKYQFADVS